MVAQVKILRGDSTLTHDPAIGDFIQRYDANLVESPFCSLDEAVHSLSYQDPYYRALDSHFVYRALKLWGCIDFCPATVSPG